jgi:hypothetical protein
LPPDAIRSLLSNEHVGGAGVEAVAVSYLWAKYLYDRRPAAA